MKEYYIKGINEQIKKTEDISLLDLIYQLLMKANNEVENPQN